MTEIVVTCKSVAPAILYTIVFFLFCGPVEATSGPDQPEIAASLAVEPEKPVTPDQFRLKQDGDDDAPSINRAITFLSRSRRNQLDFLPHPYLLRSPIIQADVSVHWQGRGWCEPAGGASGPQSLGIGTWLVVDRPDFTPVTITGPGTRGTVVDDLAVFEKQPAASNDKQWQPTPYPYVFRLEGTYGLVLFRHIMLMAVTRGINAHLSGRLQIDGLFGQVFDNAVKVDKAYDADTYNNIHLWPFWSQSTPIMTYMQSNLDALWLQRADTGLIDNMFVFGARSALRLDQSKSESVSAPGGVPTKNTVGTLHCDATRWCIWITGINVHFQAASIDSQEQKWTGPGMKPLPLKDAAVLRIEGQAVIQIGRIWQEFTDHSTISYLNPRFASNIQVGSLYEDFTYSDSNPAHVTMTSTISGQQELFLSAPPMTVLRPGQSVRNGNETTNGLVTTR